MSQYPCDVNKRVNCEHKEFILWLTTPHLRHMLEAELEKELVSCLVIARPFGETFIIDVLIKK